MYVIEISSFLNPFVLVAVEGIFLVARAWQGLYTAANICNFLIHSTDTTQDYTKPFAFHEMNLLAYPLTISQRNTMPLTVKK
jgi:hypothetical protein